MKIFIIWIVMSLLLANIKDFVQVDGRNVKGYWTRFFLIFITYPILMIALYIFVFLLSLPFTIFNWIISIL